MAKAVTEISNPDLTSDGIDLKSVLWRAGAIIDGLAFLSDTRVDTRHIRVHRRDSFFPEPKGGKTIIIMWVGDQAWRGTARCSRRDSYNRKLGRAIAICRAFDLYVKDRVGLEKFTIPSGLARENA